VDDNLDGTVDNPADALWPGSDDTRAYAIDHLLPPYNSVSRFRDPGRVNINTIFDSRIWEGVSKNFVDMDPAASYLDAGNVTFGDRFLRDLLYSRQGYGWIADTSLPNPNNLRASPANLLAFIGVVPSRFANPFRSANSADLMPILSAPFVTAQGRQTFRPTDTAGNPNSPNPNYFPLPKSAAEATLLRNHPDPNRANQPLFYVPPSTTQGENPYTNTQRNAYFTYQGLNRLSNLLTTHSNVFAVWATVGFFELEENPGGADAAHPDGYRLGPELGVDTGSVKRHRAFYVIDRSIPVGFEMGENHNVDRAILIRRVIE